MYPGLPSRLEKELKQLYLDRVLHGNTDAFQVTNFRKFGHKDIAGIMLRLGNCQNADR